MSSFQWVPVRIAQRPGGRVPVSLRERFREGGPFGSIPIMGQRDLNIKWAVGAGKAKLPLIEKGLIVDDGGAFFGWGGERGHLGKTEIFCRFDPLNPEAREAVDKWKAGQEKRASDERYFAILRGPEDELGAGLCNYRSWWSKSRKAIDPKGDALEAGSLV